MAIKSIESQRSTGYINTLDGIVELDLHNPSTGTVQVTGTWAGTITFEVSNDGFVNSYPAFFTSPTQGLTSTTSANGNFRFYGLAGYSKVRARMSSYVSGSAKVTLSSAIGNATQVVVSTGLFQEGETPLFSKPLMIGGIDSVSGLVRAAKIDPTGAVLTSGEIVLGSLPAGDNNIGNVDVLSLPPIPSGTNNIGDVDVISLPSIPSGTNNIGDVDVLSLPSIPTGSNNIGDVDVLTLPPIPSGNNNIGDVDIASIAAGDNNIGNVDIVTMPAISGTVTANAGTGVFDITPTSPAGNDYLPVRLTDGSSFYNAGTTNPVIYFYNIPSAVHVAAASTLMWDLFNADATKIVRVRYIQHIVNLETAVTGVGFEWQLLRTTTAGTGGTAQTAWLPDTTQTALDADITCRLKASGGAGASTSLRWYYTNSEETLAGNQLNGGVFDTNILPPLLASQGIVLRQNQGLRLNQETNSAAGNSSWLIGFSVE